MIGKIYINGTIGKFEDEPDGVELVDIIAQVKMQPDAESFLVYINSPGGLVTEGFDIYDYLVSLGKPITTIGQSLVASIATVIFMAGSKRILKPNTEFMIHLPSGGVEGTSEEIADYARFIEETEKRIIKFYEQHTGLTKEALKPLLSKETWLDTKKAFELGFSNTETTEKQAVAHFNLKPDNKMSKSKKQELSKADKEFFNGFFSKLGKMFGGNEPTNITIQDANGAELNFPDVAEGEDVAVEAEATVDGSPAEGEYTLPDGTVYAFEAGVLKTITPSESEEEEEEEESEDMKALRELIETLEDEKAALNIKLTAAVKEAKDAKTKLVKANTEFKSFQTQLKSKFDFTGVKKEKDNKEGEEEELTTAQKMKANLAKKRAERKQ